MTKTVVGLFDNYQDAEATVRDLVDRGFRRDDIGVVAQQHRSAGREAGGGEDVTQGAAVGAGTGAALGGLAGLLVGLGALAIPGIGPIIAAGPLATALAGAGVGAVAGGIVGALVDAGVPEEQARVYAEGVRRGGTLVTVRTTDEMAGQAADVINRHHPIDITTRSHEWRQEHWTGGETESEPFTTSESMTAATGSARTGQYDYFERYNQDFRDHYNLVYASRGYDYTTYEPAYRFGTDLVSGGQYQGRRWTEVEPMARQQWEQQHHQQPWDQVKDAVRHAWERVTSGSQDMQASTGTTIPRRGEGPESTTWTGSEGYDTTSGRSFNDPDVR